MGANDPSVAMLFPIVSTVGHPDEGAVRRFRRWSVADVRARYLSQTVGEITTLLDVPVLPAEDDAARARMVPSAIAVLERLSRTRIENAGDRLDLAADDVLEDVARASDASPFPKHILAAQRVAIGGSRGALVSFRRTDGRGEIEVFTTRPDTLFGATFLAVAPGHPTAREADPESLAAFRAECARADEGGTAKIGVPLGIAVEHPFVAGQTLPVWLGNFVVEGYGTGAAGGCPAIDQRDLDFARRYQLPAIPIICPPGQNPDTYRIGAAAHPGDGTMINSAFLDGMPVAQAIDTAIERLSMTGRGRPATQYRRSPLPIADASIPERADVERDGRPWRFTDALLTAAWFCAPNAFGQRTPQALHVTTPETATGHLLDARILWRALAYDAEPFASPEPWDRIALVGDVLDPPTSFVPAEHAWENGDAMRIAVLADTPPERDLTWSEERHTAAAKLLERAAAMLASPDATAGLDSAQLAPQIAPVAARLEAALRFGKINAAVAAAHQLITESAAHAQQGLDASAQRLVGALLYALLPDTALRGLAAGWQPTIAAPSWPQLAAQHADTMTVEVLVQINGKKRGVVHVARDAGELDVLSAVRADNTLAAQLAETPVRKTVLVPNRLVNLVV